MRRDGSIRGVLSFVQTASAGSFAAAARNLAISPVAVSKNVSRLERDRCASWKVHEPRSVSARIRLSEPCG